MFVLPDVDHVDLVSNRTEMCFFFIVDLVQVINYTELCEWW